MIENKQELFERLPKEFLQRMKQLLKEEYEEFLQSYAYPRTYGLRVNTLKLLPDSFKKMAPFKLEPISWCESGFYYQESDRPGRHPYHAAGLYYIQEPSAMAVGALLDPKPGEKVLDLCAAPGGKTTHLAALMQGKGLLVSNEIHPKRAAILSQNVERMGIKNVVVCKESAERLQNHFCYFFDKILVDAPCSGEGMFRKDKIAIEEWSQENVSYCAQRQKELLDCAADMLKTGGRLVYSTCTFAPLENEGTISQFLKSHPNFVLERPIICKHWKFSQGRADWTAASDQGIEQTIRLWPHKLKGEGHFIAVLKKISGHESEKWKGKKGTYLRKIPKEICSFTEMYGINLDQENYIIFGEQFYSVPDFMPDFSGLKVLRPGCHIGTIRKGRFEPAHALAISMKKEEFRNTVSFKIDSEEIVRYLNGETLTVDAEKGWCLVLMDDFPLGWGKVSNHILKNHYPKGLRYDFRQKI